MTDEISLRSPGEDELRAFLDPLMTAFFNDFSEEAWAAERPLIDPARFVNAFDGDRRIGSAGAFGMRLSVPGGEVPVSAITSVGVMPDHRRRGVLRKMMTWLLDDARARQEPVAVLWASEAAIYQRFGFGAATIGSHFEMDRSMAVFRAPFPPSDDVRIRMVDIDEMMRLAVPIYDTLRTRVPGTLDRAEGRWRDIILSEAEWMRRGAGPGYRAVLEVAGEPRGYAIYRIKGDWSPRGPQAVLQVSELMALDPDAEQRLWQWLFAMDLVGSILAPRGPMPHPLQHWLQEPRRLGLTSTDGLWLRFVDLPAALAARTYAGEGSLVLEVDDALIDSNAGRWQLTVRADGSAAVERTTAEPDLALDVATLACAYLGAWRFADLAQAGRVRECRAGALLAAELSFTTTRAPFANTMF